MKKFHFLTLAAIFLLGACGSASPTEEPLVELPTPTIEYQIVGTTKYNRMVVVSPEAATDREALRRLGRYLCDRSSNCIIWFWDDINKADTTYPIDEEYRRTMVATYEFSWAIWDDTLEIFTPEGE